MDIKKLKEEMTGLALRAQAVVSSDNTPAEKRAELERIEADIKSTSDKIADAEFVAERSAKYAGAGSAPTAETEPEAKGFGSIGEEFVASQQFKSVQGISGKFTSGSVDVKATFTTAGGSGAGYVQPQYQTQPVEILFRRLTVADLLPSGQMAGGSLIYPVETSVTNAAAAVAEGGAKPASTLVTGSRTENLTKIATSIKVSDEMLQDGLATAAYVNGRLVVFVQQAEETQLLSGSGVAPNMTGLLNRTGLQAAQAKGTDTVVDAIYKQITALRTNSFLEPDGIVIHPNDWQDVRLAKDANNQYYGGGPFGQLAGDVLWGLRVVITAAITEGTALVGAFGTGAAQVFRKGGLTVEATNSNEDDFLKNLVAIRAEERLLLAVYRPGAFGTVTGI